MLIFSSTLTHHFCVKAREDALLVKGNEETQMLFTFNGEALNTFIAVTKVAYVRTSSTTIESLGPLKLRLIRIILPCIRKL